MRLSKSFLVHNSNDSQIMVSSDHKVFSGMVRNNETGAFLVDLLKKDITEEEIIEAFLSEYNAPREVIEEDVKNALSILRSIGAIDE